jgi:hypothetical protein
MDILNKCFWENFEQNPYIFCEKQLCGIVVQPGNTWSNVGYLIVAVLILRSKHTGPRTRGRFFWSTLILFLGSTLFHASGTWWGKYLDVGAMFCLSMAILTTSLERKYNLERKTGIFIFVGGIFVSLIYLYFMRLGLYLFGAQIAASAFIEKRNIKKFWKSVVCFGVAFLFWIMDVKRIWCNPDNHFFNGHAVWHLTAAFAIWLFFKSYESKDSHPVL